MHINLIKLYKLRHHDFASSSYNANVASFFQDHEKLRGIFTFGYLGRVILNHNINRRGGRKNITFPTACVAKIGQLNPMIWSYRIAHHFAVTVLLKPRFKYKESDKTSPAKLIIVKKPSVPVQLYRQKATRCKVSNLHNKTDWTDRTGAYS